MHDITSTRELLERYDRPGPRYTSYPTAIEFHDGVTNDIYVERLAQLNRAGDRAAVRLHAPAVLRAAVLVLRLQRRDHAASRGRGRYLEAVEQEIDLLASHLPDRRTIAPIALGRRHADLLHARAARPPVRAIHAPLFLHAGRGARRRDRSAGHDPGAPRPAARRSASTACRWACRTSIRRSRKPSIASRATSSTRDLLAACARRSASGRSTST